MPNDRKVRHRLHKHDDAYLHCGTVPDSSEEPRGGSQSDLGWTSAYMYSVLMETGKKNIN